MKKYKYLYLILFLITILLILTNGISSGIVINKFDEGVIVDGFSKETILLIYNIVILLLLLLLSIFATVNKKNIIKQKKIILVILIALLLFVPIGILHYSGRIAGVSKKEKIRGIDCFKIFAYKNEW